MSEKVVVGSIVEGKVVKFKPFGAIIALPDNVNGLVHISHISSSYVQNINEYLSIGDVVKVKVLSADTKTGKVSLSIKEVGELPKNEDRGDSSRSERDSDSEPKPRESSSNDQFRSDLLKKTTVDATSTFEEKFKDWVKSSNERLAGINKRNKRR